MIAWWLQYLAKSFVNMNCNEQWGIDLIIAKLWQKCIHDQWMGSQPLPGWLCTREALVQRLGMPGYYNRMHLSNIHPSFNLAGPCGPYPTQKMCVEYNTWNVHTENTLANSSKPPPSQRNLNCFNLNSWFYCKWVGERDLNDSSSGSVSEWVLDLEWDCKKFHLAILSGC